MIVGENSNNRIFIINCSVQDTKVEEIGANIFEVNILAAADGKHSGGFYAISHRSGSLSRGGGRRSKGIEPVIAETNAITPRRRDGLDRTIIDG